MKILDSLSYQLLIIAALFLGLAPFTPETRQKVKAPKVFREIFLTM